MCDCDPYFQSFWPCLDQVSLLASSSPVMARAAAEAAAAAAVAAERSSSFYAGSGSEGNAYYALHDESGSCEYEANINRTWLYSHVHS